MKPGLLDFDLRELEQPESDLLENYPGLDPRELDQPESASSESDSLAPALDRAPTA